MSHQEIDRVVIVKSVKSKKLTQVEGLISKHRGKPSNNQRSAAVKSEICMLVREKYADFGSTLVHEKLVEDHNKKLSIESLRQIMISGDLWVPKQRKIKRVFNYVPDEIGLES